MSSWVAAIGRPTLLFKPTMKPAITFSRPVANNVLSQFICISRTWQLRLLALCICSIAVARNIDCRSSQVAASRNWRNTSELGRQETSKVSHGIHELPAAAAGTMFLETEVSSTG